MTSPATTEDFRTALRARDRAGINRVAERLLDQRTPLGEQWSSIAQVLVRNGEVRLAIAAAERAVEEGGGSAGAKLQLAAVLADLGRNDDAIALVSAMPPGALNPAEREHFIGSCALEKGDFELAQAAFDRAVTAWRGSGASWLSLAALPPADDQALLARLTAAGSTIVATSPDSRARWHYAKGTVLDRLGRTDEAFAEFAAGAELVRAQRAYDPEADRREADALIREHSNATINRISEQVRESTDRPILVTGLPRSGTTLVEQILTSHSKVAGGGEMPFGSILAREVGGRSLAPLESFVSSAGADHLARLYLHLGDEFFGRGVRFVDKSLDASRNLGVLASALPQARIIWLRRDPLDCAWSCFRTYFTDGVGWSWSLTDIAAHFEPEDRLHQHWEEVLGDRMLTLTYEELVADPQAHIGRILGHVGLDHEPAIDRAQDTQRAVTTASVAQVRQPITRLAVGASGPYREYLKPFLDAYDAQASAA